MIMNKYNTILQSYYPCDNSVYTWLRNTVNCLPEQIRPTSAGTSEIMRSKEAISIADPYIYEKYIQQYNGSLWLYGRGIKYSTATHHQIPSEIVAWVDRAKTDIAYYCNCLCEGWDAHNAYYGFGAHVDEYEIRNAYRILKGQHVIMSGYLGRDCRKYVPGLYWLNYYSDQYINELKLDIESIAYRLNVKLHKLRNGILMKLYDDPSSWREHEDMVKYVVANTSNMFSIDKVDLPIHDMTSRAQLIWMDEIHQKWP
jgi:hypothetical protein